jgi:hypothetical protein
MAVMVAADGDDGSRLAGFDMPVAALTALATAPLFGAAILATGLAHAA